MSPIERAARALAGWTPNVTSWADICDDPKDGEKARAFYSAEVRAVLQAIREPSPAMVSAAVHAAERIGPHDHVGIFAAMIDTALSE